MNEKPKAGGTKVFPTKSLTALPVKERHAYVPHAATDVRKTWAKFGFKTAKK